MLALLKRMIIPTMILFWSAMYVIETRLHSNRDVLLIRPLFLIILVTYLIIFFKEFMHRKDKTDTKLVFVSNKEMKILILMISYIFIVKYLGFILTSFLSMLAMLYVLEVRRVSKLLAFSVVSTLILYVAFKVILMVPLPSGIFGA